jgi:hypothetical protein
LVVTGWLADEEVDRRWLAGSIGNIGTFAACVVC